MSVSESGDMPPEILSRIVDETRPEPSDETFSDSDPELADEAVVASISCGEDEDEEEDEDIQQDIEANQTITPFTLKGTDSNFFQRSQGIFGGLHCSEKTEPHNQIITSNKTLKLPDSPEQDSLVSTAEASSFSATDARPCSESSRKRPIQRLPDYLKHPERWTKYSLEDVPDTTDQTNRNTALNFLAGLQQQREGKELLGSAGSHSYNQDSSSPGESKILFNRTQKAVRGSSVKIEQPHCQVQSSEAWNDEEQDESEGLGECKETTAVGFHGVKKRSRKNIRSKADPNVEEDSS